MLLEGSPELARTGAWVGEAAAAREASRARAPGALFAALLVLGVLPIWLVPHVPTQDGANHVESVMALLRWHTSTLLQQHYLPNYGLQPNWLTQVLFAGLVQLASPRAAEKLVLTGYLVLFPLAFRFALPRTARGRWAALAVFPFVHGYTFHMGFWNFSYSLALFFLALGYWYRARGRLDVRRGIGFTALTTALFVAHSVSTCAALAAMTSILAWRCGLGLRHARGRPARARAVLRGYVHRAAATYAFAAPAILLIAAFLVRQPKPLAYRPSLLDYAKHLAGLYSLVSFDRRELFVTCAVSAAVALAVIATLRERGRRRLRAGDGWLAAAAVASVLYFLTPDSAADGAQLNDRLGLYPFFAALLWLGYSSASARRVRALALALGALFLAGSALRVAKYREIEGYLAEYESVAPHVAEGSVLLPLTFSPFGPRAGAPPDGKKLLSYRVQVFQHTAGYVVTDRRSVDLDNSQANTHHAPLRWRPERNPFTLLSTEPFGVESEPPCVELRAYTRLAGRIDYVLVWGDTEAGAAEECGAAVLGELARSYERVFVSRPRGLAQLYRPRAAEGAAPGARPTAAPRGPPAPPRRPASPRSCRRRAAGRRRA